MDRWSIPLPEHPEDQIAQSDDFPDGRPGLQWQWQANPQERFFAQETASHVLRLACLPNEERENLLWYAPNALTQIPQHKSLTATVQVTLSEGGALGDIAALGVIGHAYGYLGLQRSEGGRRLALYRGIVTEKAFAGEASEMLEAALPLTADTVWLRLSILDGKTYGFSWSADGSVFTPFGTENPLRRATWTGAKLCLWACSRNNLPSRGFGAFSHFQICPVEQKT